MVVRIIIAGEAQCEMFAQACLIADYLTQNLPSLCYEQIEKSASEWKTWLAKINRKHKWHHCTSPLIWKEAFMQGSKAYYIGGAPEFVDYCHSYYKFETFLSIEKLDTLVQNVAQFKNNITTERLRVIKSKADFEANTKSIRVLPPNNELVICISGASHSLVPHLISGLLDKAVGEKSVSKIYLNDEFSKDLLNFFETECSYVNTDYNGKKVVRYIDRLGLALSHSDLLIIMDHVHFDSEKPIGDWLEANRKLMEELAYLINASAASNLAIMLPNMGPACYNATILRNTITSINKQNIVVATSDLGLDILTTLAEIAEVPIKNIFCPPVWGFVGINHLVDVRTTVHKYNSFDPYNRYIKVKNSTLTIGSLTPQMRTMEYLMYWDKTLWKNISERKVREEKFQDGELTLNKAIAMLNLIKLWYLMPDPENIVSLGIVCDGSFGLTFDGVFSQPAHLVNGFWVPASDYIKPKDSQMKLSYLQYIAEDVMKLEPKALPKLNPCKCWIKIKPKSRYREKAKVILLD